MDFDDRKNNSEWKTEVTDGIIQMDIKTEPEFIVEHVESSDEDETDVHNFCDGDEPSNKSQTTNKPRKKYKQVRPKVSTEWSHYDIMKLINALEERPRLWNKRLMQYKLPKTEAWQEIADVLGRDVDECKAKWANLRVTFKQNVSKYKKHKSDPAVFEAVVWRYFHAMKFVAVDEIYETNELASSITLLSENSNLSMVETEPSTSSQQKRRKVPLAPRESISSMMPLSENSIESESPISPQPPISSKLPTSELPTKSQQKHRKIPLVSPPSPPLSSSSHSDAFMEMAARAMYTIADRTEIKDQFYAFGIHVAAELRSLPLTEALLAKRKLARALVDIMDEIQSKIDGKSIINNKF